jgi:hypothetical protein
VYNFFWLITNSSYVNGKIETYIGYERKIPKWNNTDKFDVVLNVVAGVDVGMGMCVSVGGLMGALTFLVELFYFIMI